MANPTETALSESAANALSGTTDPNTGAPYNTIGESPYYTNAYRKEAVWNRVLALANGLRVVKDGDLTFGVWSGAFMDGATARDYAGSSSNALTDDATNYIYLDPDATLQTNTTGFPDAAHVPLATIVTASGDYDRTDITDRRQRAVFGVVGRSELEARRISLMADCRNVDGTVLDAAGGAGLFSISAGGYGTGTLILKGENTNSNTKTESLCFEFMLPEDYIADADVKLRVRAKYDDSAGTVGTKTLDAEVYELDDDGAVGSDIQATAIQTLTNSFADYDFTITDTGLAAGDRLMVLIEGVLQETAGGGNIWIEIGSIEVQYDRAVRG